MGVYEEEKELIREAIKNEILILSICLGSQLIASAIGCRVYSYKRELGLFEVKKYEDDEIVKDLPEKLMVFQWNNDTFKPSKDAKCFA